jgi:hypothetical protein
MDDPTQGCADEKIDCNHTNSSNESIHPAAATHFFSSLAEYVRPSVAAIILRCDAPCLACMPNCKFIAIAGRRNTKKYTPAAATARTFCLEVSEIYLWKRPETHHNKTLIKGKKF